MENTFLHKIVNYCFFCQVTFVFAGVTGHMFWNLVHKSDSPWLIKKIVGFFILVMSLRITITTTILKNDLTNQVLLCIYVEIIHKRFNFKHNLNMKIDLNFPVITWAIFLFNIHNWFIHVLLPWSCDLCNRK